MLSCLIFSLIVVHAQEEDENQAMNEYIHALMSKMTLEEKLGQLNLPVSGDIVTGQAKIVMLLQRYVQVKLAACLI